MVRLPQISGKRLVRLLEKKGYYLVRWHGSHAIMDNGIQVIPVPCHSNRPLKKGTLRAIIRDAGISMDELIQLFEKT